MHTGNTTFKSNEEFLNHRPLNLKISIKGFITSQNYHVIPTLGKVFKNFYQENPSKKCNKNQRAQVKSVDSTCTNRTN